MILSPNFQLSEFIDSQMAIRNNIDNTPSDKVLFNLTYVAEQLEKVRSLLGTSIFISSGYRSPQLNKAVGGVVTSQHVLGEAVDFTSPKFGTPKQIVEKIKASGIEYDQLILEFERWVHISFTKSANRKQALVIDHSGTRIFA